MGAVPPKDSACLVKFKVLTDATMIAVAMRGCELSSVVAPLVFVALLIMVSPAQAGGYSFHFGHGFHGHGFHGGHFGGRFGFGFRGYPFYGHFGHGFHGFTHRGFHRGFHHPHGFSHGFRVHHGFGGRH